MRPDPGQRRSDTRCRPSVHARAPCASPQHQPLSKRPCLSRRRPRSRRDHCGHARRFCLADLGVYGFDRHETTILAALVTEDPLLLVGRSGTGKTFLLNTLSEALGLEHRHYNASLISFDDLVGFPYPDDAHTTVRFLETPATVWGAESVLIDEISRCKPEHQNRLFSLVHERRLQGLPLGRLRYRWAAMNPCTSDQGGVEDYSGSEALDPALADRFSLIVPAADWSELSSAQQQAIVAPSGEGIVTPRNEALCDAVSSWRALFAEQVNACPQQVTTYVTTVVNALERCPHPHLAAKGAAIGAQPRRRDHRRGPRHLDHLQERARVQPAAPDLGTGDRPRGGRRGASRGVGCLASDRRRVDPCLSRGAEPCRASSTCCSNHCTDPDEGSQAVAQLIANESPDRAAAFAFVTYPAALTGELPIGAEGVNDLAKLAVPLLDAEGELSWQERLGEKGTSHPVIAADRPGAGASCATPGSHGRDSSSPPAWCAASRCRPRRPLEQQLHECVQLLRKRVVAAGERS